MLVFGYPNTLFDTIIKKRICPVPCIQGFQENIQKDQVRVAHKPYNDSQLVFSKLKTETNNKANAVCTIKCNDCEGAYIGQTKQYLHRRCASHENKSLLLKYLPKKLIIVRDLYCRCYTLKMTKLPTTGSTFKNCDILNVIPAI